MKYFDAFTGIGGFTKGILDVIPNAECVGYSEIDKYASAIYKNHYPNHKNYGNITAINESKLPNFDLFVGGFPCQAFSIAGKRHGFKDTRGTLFFDVARILSAKKPRCFILENVKGLLNHESGRTFSTIYGVLTELGYSVGWEVVNSCHFGVPQNRERIFIIGHLRGKCIREIFPIGENNTGINERTRETQVAGCLTAGGNSGGLHSNMTLLATNFQGKDIANTIRSGGFGIYTDKHNWDTVRVGAWRTHKDGNGFREIESGLAPTIPARAREDGSGQPVIKVNQLNNSKESGGKQPYQHNRIYDSNGLSTTLNQECGRWGVKVKAVLTPNRVEKRQNGRRFKEEGEPSFTLTSQDKHGVQINERIRRLTPTECERLQAFPDGWTKYGLFDGVKKEISDTQRYKTLGNSVTVSVINAIIKKL